MLIIEFDFEKFVKFGMFRQYPQNKIFFRMWFGYISITYTKYNLHDLCKDIKNDKIHWVNP